MRIKVLIGLLYNVTKLRYELKVAPQFVHFLSVSVKQQISPKGKKKMPHKMPSKVMCSSKAPT